jgi:hypothetical protein
MAAGLSQNFSEHICGDRNLDMWQGNGAVFTSKASTVKSKLLDVSRRRKPSFDLRLETNVGASNIDQGCVVGSGQLRFTHPSLEQKDAEGVDGVEGGGERALGNLETALPKPKSKTDSLAIGSKIGQKWVKMDIRPCADPPGASVCQRPDPANRFTHGQP